MRLQRFCALGLVDSSVNSGKLVCFQNFLSGYRYSALGSRACDPGSGLKRKILDTEPNLFVKTLSFVNLFCHSLYRGCKAPGFGSVCVLSPRGGRGAGKNVISG